MPHGIAEQDIQRWRRANGSATFKIRRLGHFGFNVVDMGGTVDDIIYMTIRMKDRDDRKFVDPHWLAMFPDENDRPARHAEHSDLAGGMLMQCQITAVLPSYDHLIHCAPSKSEIVGCFA